MNYMLIPVKGEPPYRRFDNQENLFAALEYAQVMAPSQGDVTIWQAVRLVRLKPDVVDLTIPVVPEPPRRGRPRKVEKRPEYPDAFGCLKAPEKPATPEGIIIDSAGRPYHDGVYRGPFYGNEKPVTPSALVIESYGCAKDPDGVYRACILYTRNGVTDNAIGRHEDSPVQATWNALVDIGIVYMPDLEALPDTEGKRQVLAAVGATTAE